LQRHRHRRTVAVFCAACFLAPKSRAQLPPETEEQARAIYGTALKHYNVAEYTEAIENFKQAYLLTNAPELLYDIAQAYRLKGPGNCALAAQFYGNYLRVDPRGSKRASAEGALADVQACAKEESAAASASAPTPAASAHAPPEEATQTAHSPAALWLGGAGAVLAATGGVFAVLTKLQYDSLRSSRCAPSCDSARVSTGRAEQLIGNVLLGVGTAALVGAVTIWFVSSPTSTKRAWVAPTVGGLRAGLFF
jgi:hypothetical protein